MHHLSKKDTILKTSSEFDKSLLDRATQLLLSDDDENFSVTFVKPTEPKIAVLFAVGAGGNPERHLPLLNALAQQGCAVVAPHFERFISTRPSPAELELRARRLRLALDAANPRELPVAGVGHSIGSAMLLALAGAQMWMSPNSKLEIKPDTRLKKLVLMTPATGFFQSPGALDALSLPMQVWAGSLDTVTPPEQALLIEQGTKGRATVDLRIKDGAGHFSFMNSPPPNTQEPLSDREQFLYEVTNEIIKFVSFDGHG
jgi:alpha-beta hydrolase superfamily lysophospholipase